MADPKDEFLVALARDADVVALVSGDPHLTELVNQDPAVMTPAAFLNHPQVTGATVSLVPIYCCVR